MENKIPTNLRLGTRASPLAMIQAKMAQEALMKKHPHLQIELITMTTTGDQYTKGRLSDLGGKGLFVKELQEALYRGDIDFAVHSAKDMETITPEVFDYRPILTRGAVEDVFVSNQHKSLDDLPDGAVVGTSSLRREAILKNERPDIQTKLLRGNMNTRLAKLDQRDYDAIILARAGLERLGLSERITQILPIEFMVPSATQGILAVEFLKARTDLAPFMDSLVHKDVALSFGLERLFLSHVDGTCHTPVGCHTQIHGDQVHFWAACGRLDGQNLYQENAEFPLSSATEEIITRGKEFKLWLKQNT